jgi:hypothetical protein
MNAVQFPQLDADSLEHLVEGLANVGVVGNEGDRRFDMQDVGASLQAFELQVRDAGYEGGSLAMETLVKPHDGVDILVYDQDRYESAMGAEEVWRRDYQNRLRKQVEDRVEDWRKRLQSLRSLMEKWLQGPEFRALHTVDQPPARMFEDIMRRFDVPPSDVPVFEIRDGSRRVMRVQPKGLWVIGANGRVDLITKAAAPILVDKSEPLSDRSNWQIYDARDRVHSVPLTQNVFNDLVRAGLE